MPSTTSQTNAGGSLQAEVNNIFTFKFKIYNLFNTLFHNKPPVNKNVVRFAQTY